MTKAAGHWLKRGRTSARPHTLGGPIGTRRFRSLHRLFLALFCLLPLLARAQTPNFDKPLQTVALRLPLNHPPVDLVCSDGPGFAMEVRYFQKNPADDGLISLKIAQGQTPPPSCDKIAIPTPPVQVTCTAYPGFLVKERHVEGDEGNEGVSLIPFTQAIPPCEGKVAAGEMALAEGNEGGTLWGVKGQYLFLTEPDSDLFGARDIVLYRVDSPRQITSFALLDTPADGLGPTPDGFTLRLTTDIAEDCGVAGEDHASRACLERLTKAAGAKISLAACLHAIPQKDPRNPTAIAYPALLSIQGRTATLRATGDATTCIPQM